MQGWPQSPVERSSREGTGAPRATGAETGVTGDALFLLALEKTITTEIFDKIIQRYYQTYAFRHVRPYDFIKICEEVSGQDLDTLFNSFLNTTEFCDWGVNDVLGNTVEIENKGNLKIPVDLHILTDSGKQLFHLDAQAKEYTVVVPDSLGEIQSAALDPHVVWEKLD